MISLQLLAAATHHTSTGEAWTFWVVAPIAFLTALGVVLSRNAVHSALWLIATLFCISVLFAAQRAPFLFAVEITVYAGAIMMLFLFVIMLVGRDTSESLVETLRGQRPLSILLSLGFAGLLIYGIVVARDMSSTGLSGTQSNDNVFSVAQLLYSPYVIPFEATSALLITAAIGAMVLAHRERTEPRPTQQELSRRRFAGTHPTPLPGPGVYATHDAVDAPALLPDGSAAPGSVPPSLQSVSRQRFTVEELRAIEGEDQP